MSLSLHSPLAYTAIPAAVARRVHAQPVDVDTMTRYRGGTYSHTVDTVVFADGTSARTDLIRLNPGIDAYSLDFTGIAPATPSRYRAATWSAVPHLRTRMFEPEVDWILRNSFPTLTTRELSGRLRAAGQPLGTGNIAEHEAIAATQAAIWHFTNDLLLDTRPLNAPSATHRVVDGIVFEFAGAPQLGGFTVDVRADGPATMTLQKSADGSTFRDVPGSRIAIDAGARTYRKALGVGSTLSAAGHGQPRKGYRFYRLRVTGSASVELGKTSFWLDGAGHFQNADRVVALYNYLLAGAAKARENAVELQLTDADERRVRVAGELVGPFRLQATDAAALSVSSGVIVDADGRALTGPLRPGTEFYVRVDPSLGEVSITVRVPALATGTGGRVITGIARDDETGRLTPVALAVPAQVTVEFALSWPAGVSRTSRRQ